MAVDDAAGGDARADGAIAPSSAEAPARTEVSASRLPASAAPSTPLTPEAAPRRRYGAEVLIVLGLSLGQSAVYAVVSLIDKLTTGPLKDQTAPINVPQSPRQYFDLTYQLLDVFFTLLPVALALFFLSAAGRGALRRMGFDGRRPVADVLLGVALAAVIGGGTLAFYAGGRALGITASLQPNALNDYWWTVPVLILAAAKNGILEEVLMVGYLLDRLPRLGWSVPVIIVVSALLRGSYHLYQGFGPFIGNALMGAIFALFYLRYKRVMPLVIAHTLLDVVGFLLPTILTSVGS
jgi:membrane protease YdiL (CAAX protease family)